MEKKGIAPPKYGRRRVAVAATTEEEKECVLYFFILFSQKSVYCCCCASGRKIFFLNRLILTLSFSFSTYHTSMIVNEVNGANLNEAKMDSIIICCHNFFFPFFIEFIFAPFNIPLFTPFQCIDK